MAKRNHSNADLLEEAGSATTSAARLQVLFQKEPTLGRIIASNPSTSWKLLDQLALKYPAEVLANPLLPLRVLEKGAAYSEFSLAALVSLCMVSNSEQNAVLLEQTRRRLIDGLTQVIKRDYFPYSCYWSYRHTFTLKPEDCDNLIEQAIELTLEVRQPVSGGSEITHVPQSLAHEALGSAILLQTQLTQLLQSIATGQLNDYIESRVTHDSEREIHDGYDLILTSDPLPSGYSISEFYLCKDEKTLFAIKPLLLEHDAPSFENGILWVGVGEPEEVDREYEVSLGELDQLTRLTFDDTGIAHGWPDRLAALQIP